MFYATPGQHQAPSGRAGAATDLRTPDGGDDVIGRTLSA
jgi:hypothetical protein